MTVSHFHTWLPFAVASAGTIAAVILRYLTLLAGLLATLCRAAQNDRLYIFREFARAISSSRTNAGCRQACTGRAESRSCDLPQ